MTPSSHPHPGMPANPGPDAPAVTAAPDSIAVVPGAIAVAPIPVVPIAPFDPPPLDETRPPSPPPLMPSMSPVRPAERAVRREVRPLPRRAYVLLVAGGVGAWAASASGVGSLGGALYAVTTAVALCVSGLFGAGRRMPVALASSGAVFGMFLMVHDSPWLTGLNICALIVMFTSAAYTAQEHSIFDASLGWVRDRLSLTFGSSLKALAIPFEAWGMLQRGRQEGRATAAVDPEHDHLRRRSPIKGIVLVTPLLLVVVPLLMIGDAVFSKLLSVPLRFLTSIPLPSVVDVFFGGWGIYAAAVLVAIATAGQLVVTSESARAQVAQHRTKTFAARDVHIALWIMNLVLGLFAVSQVIAATTLASRLLDSPLTYEAIAKRGFFPLLVASIFVLGAFVVAHSMTSIDERRAQRFRVPAQLLAVLSLLLVVAASRRLMMGAQVWGLTMLRVLSQTFAVWLALVFIAVALYQHRVSTRSWVPGGSMVAAASLLLLLNVVPTEQLVVHWNATSGFTATTLVDDDLPIDDDLPTGTEFPTGMDRSSGGGLSSCRYYGDAWHGRNDDALPALIGWLRTEVKAKRATNDCARRLLGCDDIPSTRGLSWNLARWNANEIRSATCREFPYRPDEQARVSSG
jgi:Domain of unknown function (DUF4173)